MCGYIFFDAMGNACFYYKTDPLLPVNAKLDSKRIGESVVPRFIRYRKSVQIKRV
jgi:hypothetical protein